MDQKTEIRDSLYWWLSKNRSFNINDEYQIDLIGLDIDRRKARIRIARIVDGVAQVKELPIAQREDVDGNR